MVGFGWLRYVCLWILVMEPQFMMEALHTAHAQAMYTLCSGPKTHLTSGSYKAWFLESPMSGESGAFEPEFRILVFMWSLGALWGLL